MAINFWPVTERPRERLLAKGAQTLCKLIGRLRVAAQNHLGADGLAKVEEQYAKTRRERAKKGDRIQLPSGKWARK